MAFMAKILASVMAFSPPEYCRLCSQRKAYQGGVTGTPVPPLATPLCKQVQRLAHLSRMGKTCFLIFICLHYIIAYQAKRLELLTRMNLV